MNQLKKSMSVFISIICVSLLFIACEQKTAKNNGQNFQSEESTLNQDSATMGNDIEHIENVATQKRMTISKEGMIDTIMATLYHSPKDSPLQFTLYYPSELEMEEKPTEGFTLNFTRNEALLQLHLFPKEIDSEEQAMSLIREKIEALGEIIEKDDSYRLAPNAEISSFIELFERDGVFYYWWSKYPVEYGDGFGAEIYFIKENLEWESRFNE